MADASAQKSTTLVKKDMQDYHQASEYGQYLSQLDWHIFEGKHTQIFCRRLPLINRYIIKAQRINHSLQNLEDFIDCHTHFKPIAAYVEFNQSEQNFNNQIWKDEGFHPIKRGMLPTKTLRINLLQPLPNILKSMHSKTRYNINLSIRHGLISHVYAAHQVIHNSTLYHQIYQLLRENAKRQHFWPLPNSWFQALIQGFEKKAFIVNVYTPKNELAATLICLTHYHTVYYNANGSSLLGRKVMAATRATFEAIKYAHAKKYQWFDFDGVFDSRYPISSWQGFTRFKKSFGGEELLYPPAYRKWGSLSR